MTELQINSNGLVSQLIDKYTIWCDATSFYRGYHQPKISHSSSGIPCYNVLDLRGINSNKNSLVAIDCLTEGIHCIPLFKKYEKSNKYLIFSNGKWDKEYYDLGINYELMYHKFFLFEMADTCNTPNRFSFYLDKTYLFEDVKQYTFLSTIGNKRPERDYLIDRLQTKLPHKNYLLKYSGKIVNGDGQGDVVEIADGPFDPYTLIVKKYFHNVSQTFPIKLFNKARFNLIVESDLDWNHEFFLTEKTIKNLIVGMPFVMVSTPNFLKNLKEIGFETYSSLWDESYDTIDDYKQRVEKIVELCDNLESFDWAKANSELIRIGNHNRLTFLSLGKDLENEFLQLESTIDKLEL